MSARNLRKCYGDHVVVDGLNLSIRRGECFGLLGPNGAGKTTTLRLMLGLIAPDEGELRLFDHAVPQQEVDQLAGVLKSCAVTSLVEVHPGTEHGYSFPERKTFQRAGAERNWERIFAMFQRQLHAGSS